MTPEAIQKIEALIEEAVHANHPNLDKRKMGSGPEANTVRKNRNELAGKINHHRKAAASPGRVPRHAKEKIKNFQNNMAKATSLHGKTVNIAKVNSMTANNMRNDPGAIPLATK